ncbi:hypothetical protein [Actinokineospora sp. NBRC 105648]|uniref:hypothetical protein n=1 Tax=Actinokineospora sp. NBRC 105648 TaxID=3032206 RepID=UPI0024A4FEE8|nr:hypothetical protein [Actinokineospora sp. NBRC 105648]GLZ40292.1 hypothetical protein Acsp05_39160 [Actinokineospora sp. NBRC 105648]
MDETTPPEPHDETPQDVGGERLLPPPIPTPAPVLGPERRPEQAPDPEPNAGTTPRPPAPADTEPEPVPAAPFGPDTGPIPVLPQTIAYGVGAGPETGGYARIDPASVHQPRPEPSPPPAVDPLAAALGNASLLAIGYLLLRRRWLAVLAVLVTVGYLLVSALVVRNVFFHLVLVLWAGALAWHGWWLAAKSDAVSRPRRQRVIGGAALLPVLLVVTLLRLDAAGIESDSDAARDGGDCDRTVAEVQRLSFAHQLADPPLVVRGEHATRTCLRLAASAAALKAGLSGRSASLSEGFSGLAGLLQDEPAYDNVVRHVLDGFLADLSGREPCEVADVTQWLRDHRPDGDALGRAADVVPSLEPRALMSCGDRLVERGSFQPALARYKTLVAKYPSHELAPRAKESAQKAQWAIELEAVRSALGVSTGVRPPYCDAATPYTAAPPHGPPGRAYVAGSSEYTKRLPADWLVDDVAKATVVLCVSPSAQGSVAETCPYKEVGGLGRRSTISFHRIAIPVRAIELATGRVLSDSTLEIGGATCPEFITAKSGDVQEKVTPTDADVHAAFAPLVKR